MAHVPCNGCTACCRHDVVVLGPQDNLLKYQWHIEFGLPVLDRRDDGACVYLTDSGCGIHGRAPGICQRMDCRELVSMTPIERQAQREKENPQMIRIYAAARERLDRRPSQ